MLSNEELKKHIGMKIRHFREEKRLTQTVLGNKLGVANNSISAYERGKVNLDSETLFKIADILDVKVDDLFPPTEYDEPYVDISGKFIPGNLNVEDIRFLQKLTEKTLSLEGEEREKFLESIRFTVEFYERNSN